MAACARRRGCFERWTSVPFSTLGPVLVAEAMSWTGVLSGDSKFYCAEYVLWMLIAFTWAWDAAEIGPLDTLVHRT